MSFFCIGEAIRSGWMVTPSVNWLLYYVVQPFVLRTDEKFFFYDLRRWAINTINQRNYFMYTYASEVQLILDRQFFSSWSLNITSQFLINVSTLIKIQQGVNWEKLKEVDI